MYPPRDHTNGSATDRVAAQLRTEIVRGALAPGELLSEVDTAHRLSISRTPVREAFLRLEAEGLLTRSQGRLHVLELTDHQAELVNEVRLPLELVALRQAMARDQRALAYQLERTVVELRYELDQGKVMPALDAARAFHEVIYSMTDNPLLTRVLDQVFNHVHQYRFFGSSRGADRLAQSELDHRAIVAAVRAGDHAEAERQMTRHLAEAHDFRINEAYQSSISGAAFAPDPASLAP